MSDDAAIKQLEDALALQKKAFLRNQHPSLEERKANIGKIPGMVIANREAILTAMNKDFGTHPKAAIDMVEILGVAGRAAYVLSQIDKWTAADLRDVDAHMFGDATGEIRYQPKGVIGNIVRKLNLIPGVNFDSMFQPGTSLLIYHSDHYARCWLLETE
jgi:coniferyl-aldehyde dehydrogenase